MYSLGAVECLKQLRNESPLKIYYDEQENLIYFKRGYAEAVSSGDIVEVSSAARAWFDPRPATTLDIEQLLSAVSERFGRDVASKLKKLVSGSLVYVSTDSTPLADHVKEFFVGGEPLAILFFDLEKWRLDVVPRRLMVSLLLEEGAIGRELGISLDTSSDGVARGLKLVVENGTEIAFEDFRDEVDESLYVRYTELKSRSWDEVYRANETTVNQLVNKVKRATEWLEKHLGKKGLLAFSGGKDSVLAACLLTEVESNFVAVYTHIEFGDPEDVKGYSERIASLLGFDLHVIEHRWGWVSKLLSSLGMPYRGYRWCTYVFKFYPQMRFAKSAIGFSNLVSYTGARKYETAKRSIKPATYIDADLGIVSHSVPYSFPRLLEMLMLRYRYRIEIFRDYDRGFERLSCIACPYKTCFELTLSEKLYSESFVRWEPYINVLCRVVLPSDPVTARKMHLWRIGYQLRYYSALRKFLGLHCRLPTPIHSVTKPDPSAMSRAVRNVRALFSEAEVSEHTNSLRIACSGCQVEVQTNGRLILLRGKIEECIDLILCLNASLYCSSCEICRTLCRRGALSLPFEVDSARCSRCLSCIRSCPAAFSRLLKMVSRIRGSRAVYHMYRLLKDRRAREYIRRVEQNEKELHASKEQITPRNYPDTVHYFWEGST
ncbi:MAG: phosphoadenosine phosphosulfate reductase family protein [Crenarchaeota archaeon]|nr:phosphoadenosine phosphosulfate reductase family protein [Thermoproteota archaeon]